MNLPRGDAILRRFESGHHAVAVPFSCAEIGVAQGDLSHYLLSHHPGVDLVMVDHWRESPPESNYRRWGSRVGDGYAVGSQELHDANYKMACGRVRQYMDRVCIMRMDSREAAERIPDASMDIVFIDADHSYEGVKRDIALWSPKIKQGGWLAGHDFGRFDDDGVRRAVEEVSDNCELDEDCTWFVRL